MKEKALKEENPTYNNIVRNESENLLYHNDFL